MRESKNPDIYIFIMGKRNVSIAFFLVFGLIQACIIAPDYSIIPEINFEWINKNVIDQGRVRDDSLYIRIGFTDGDGDIGDEQNKANIFMQDDRDGMLVTYSMPLIPQKGVANGVSGTITVLHTTLFNVCCYYPNADPCSIPDKPTTDTVTYSIYIEDRAGHKSNVITMQPIVINCK